MKSSRSDAAWAEAMGLSVDEFRRRFTPWKVRGKSLPPVPSPHLRVVKNAPSKSTRARIIERDGNRCRYCTAEVYPNVQGPLALTIDHVVPLARGGTNHPENLVVACQACNQEKSHLLTSEWQEPVALNGITAALQSRVPTTQCPDCTDGMWVLSDGRECPTCEGSGELTAERAIRLYLDARARIKAERSKRHEAQGEARRLRSLIEDEIGRGAARRDLAESVARQGETIRQMGDAILRLKVQVAELGGSDLDRMIPRPVDRERALRLVEARTS